MTEYRINLAGVRSFDEFIGAFNAGMIRSIGGRWNGNLDALNDYLSWPEPDSYRLRLVDWNGCAKTLAQSESPDDRAVISAVREVFADNPHVSVTFE